MFHIPQKKRYWVRTIAFTTITGCLVMAIMGMTPSKNDIRGQAIGDDSSSSPPHPKTEVVAHIELVRIDLDDTTKAAMNSSQEPINIDSLTEQSLKNGTAKVLSVMDIAAVVGHEFNAQSRNSIPYITASNKTESGITNNQIAYQKCGIFIKADTRWENDKILARWSVEYSDFKKSDIALSEDVKAHVFFNIEQEFTTCSLPGQVIMTSVGSIESNGTILVTHIVFQGG